MSAIFETTSFQGSNSQGSSLINSVGSIHKGSAIDVNRFAGDEIRQGGSQEHDRTGHVLGGLKTTQRGIVDIQLADLLRADAAQAGLPACLTILHAGVHVSGTDRVDGDPIRRQFARRSEERRVGKE